MAHGEHWEVFIGDISKLMKNLRLIMEKGTAVEVLKEQKLHNESHPDEDGYLSLEYGDTPARCLAVVEQKTGAKGLEFRSACPFLKEGGHIALELVNIKEYKCGFEAVIEGVSQDGFRMNFFDPFYGCNRNAYTKGKKFEFSLAALAYVLEKVEDTTITLTEGAMLEIERQRRLEEDPNADVSQIKSVDVSMAELRTLIPLENDVDAEFQTVVEDVSYFTFLDTVIWRISVEFRSVEDQMVKTVLYASGHVLKGYRPSVGDSIRGVLWLQGYPLRTVEQAKI